MKVRILTLFDDEPQEIPVSDSKPKRSKKSQIVDNKEAQKSNEPKENQNSPTKRATETTYKIESPKTTAQKEDKNYYSIGETAQKFKVRISHIRFWTVQFGMKVRTNRKGDRLYTPENIEQLKVIHHLVKEQGYTIAGAKAKLKELKHTNLESLQKNNIIHTLKNLQNTLQELRNQIQQL